MFKIAVFAFKIPFTLKEVLSAATIFEGTCSVPLPITNKLPVAVALYLPKTT